MKNLILTLIITLPLTLWGQGWENFYPLINWDESVGTSIDLTLDGGYIVTGQEGDILSMCFLLKTDSLGNQLWKRTFSFGTPPESETNLGKSVKQTSDGGYIITGYGGLGLFLLKTDEYGYQQWLMTYGDDGFSTGNSVEQTNDGGYIITGSSYNQGFGSDLFLMKTDSVGNIEWYNFWGDEEFTINGSTFSYFGNDFGVDVKICNNGGYIVVGTKLEIIQQNNQYCLFILKVDEVGNEIWTKTIPSLGPHNSIGYSLILNSNNEILITGDIVETDVEYDIKKLIVLKLNSNGDEIWNNTYDVYDGNTQFSVSEIVNSYDSNYIIITSKKIIKLGENGELVWIKELNINDNLNGYSIKETYDNGLIITGIGYENSINQNTVFLKKTNQFGVSDHVSCDSVQSLFNDNYFTQSGLYNNVNENYISTQNVIIYSTPGIISGLDTVTLGDQTIHGILNTDDNNQYEIIIENGNGEIGPQMNPNELEINTIWNEVGTGSILMIETNSYGCIDTTLFTIEVLPPNLTYSYEIEGCDSIQSLVDETFFYESGEYIDSLTNIYGGDSIIIQNVSIISNDGFLDLPNEINLYYDFGGFVSYENICVSNSSFENNYQLIIESPNYYFNQTSNQEEIDFPCFSFELNEIFSSNECTITLIESGPLESSLYCVDTTIYYVNLSFEIPNFFEHVELGGCDSIQSLVDESFFYESGEYIDTLTNIYGGDSIIIQNVEVYSNPEIVQINGNVSVFNSSLEFYQLTEETDNLLEWDITGGSIYENQNNIIQVLWGNEGIGYVKVTETDTNGCSTTSTLEVTISNESTNINDYNKNRKLIKTINLLGQEIIPKTNHPFIEIYDDGTRKRKIIIE